MTRNEIFGWFILLVSLCLSAILEFVIPIFQDFIFLDNAFAISSKMSASLWIYTVLLSILFIYVYSTRKNYKINKRVFKNNVYNYWNIQRIIIIGIMTVLIIVFSIYNISNYIKIDQYCILYKKHGIKKEYINWNEVQEIRIDVVPHGYMSFYTYHTSIKPRLIIITDNEHLEIWQYNNPGRLKYNELLRIIDFINNKNLNIVIDNDSIEKYYRDLSKMSKGDIVRLFEYIESL